jgi:uncharacterized protein with von Willebrand factor type A (vWA) domain
VSGPVVVQLVDELERAGMVERHRNPQDRREYAEQLTEDGRTRLGQARKAVDAVQAEVTAQLGEADDHELRALLRRLLTAPPVIRTRRASRTRTCPNPDPVRTAQVSWQGGGAASTPMARGSGRAALARRESAAWTRDPST